MKFLILISKKYKAFINNKTSFYFFLALLVFVSFAVGERSNFIKTFLMCIALLFLIDRINFKKKLISLILLIVVFFTIILNKPYFKYRFWDMFLSPLFKNPIEYVSNSKYGSQFIPIKHFEIYQNYSCLYIIYTFSLYIFYSTRILLKKKIRPNCVVYFF